MEIDLTNVSGALPEASDVEQHPSQATEPPKQKLVKLKITVRETRPIHQEVTKASPKARPKKLSRQPRKAALVKPKEATRAKRATRTRRDSQQVEKAVSFAITSDEAVCVPTPPVTPVLPTIQITVPTPTFIPPQSLPSNRASAPPTSKAGWLARLSIPSPPITTFVFRGLHPQEPKMDRQYCIYVPHEYNLIKAICEAPSILADDVFAVITGHVGVKGETFQARGSILAAPYVAFEKDFARTELLASKLPGTPGVEAWTRIEFGRDARDYGMNYSERVKREKGRADTGRARRRCAGEESDPEAAYWDEAGALKDDGDGVYDPSRHVRKRGRRG